jgi:hypothetical protein
VEKKINTSPREKEQKRTPRKRQTHLSSSIDRFVQFLRETLP